jgi:hypothetical protein
MPRRELVIAAFAIILGIGVAWVDTRPKWDDAGVTAGALLLTACVAAGAGLRWWVAALLVALPTLVAELSSAGWGITIALVVTCAGSLVGVAIRRLVSNERAG